MTGETGANYNNNNNEAEEEQEWPSAKRRRSDPESGGRSQEAGQELTPQEAQEPGGRFTPRPLPVLPAWFHPPMALPALVTKEEVLEEGEGVTPPLMSPISSPVSGLATPGSPGSGVMDPRHILHLLARKVRKLFAEISSNG